MAFADCVNDGAAPLGHLTLGQLVVKLVAVPSCTILNVKLHGPGGAVKVYAIFSFCVIFCLFPIVQSTVGVVPELPLSISVVK